MSSGIGHDCTVTLPTEPHDDDRARRRPAAHDSPDVPSSPAATRARPARWRDPRLAVGVALVVVSGLLGGLVLGAPDGTARVWAVRDGVTAGETLTAADLVAREVRFGDQADADRYVPATSTLPPGTTAARDVGAGELLPRAVLAGARDPLVEVPLTVPAEALPASVREGSVVDVWVTPDPELASVDDAPAARSTLVFAGVSVVAVPRVAGALSPASVRQVIIGLAASQEDVLPLALAQLARGSVVLVRRS